MTFFLCYENLPVSLRCYYVRPFVLNCIRSWMTTTFWFYSSTSVLVSSNQEVLLYFVYSVLVRQFSPMLRQYLLSLSKIAFASVVSVRIRSLLSNLAVLVNGLLKNSGGSWSQRGTFGFFFASAFSPSKVGPKLWNLEFLLCLIGHFLLRRNLGDLSNYSLLFFLFYFGVLQRF